VSVVSPLHTVLTTEPSSLLEYRGSFRVEVPSNNAASNICLALYLGGHGCGQLTRYLADSGGLQAGVTQPPREPHRPSHNCGRERRRPQRSGFEDGGVLLDPAEPSRWGQATALVYRCTRRHPLHGVPVLAVSFLHSVLVFATSSTTQRTGARHVIPE